MCVCAVRRKRRDLVSNYDDCGYKDNNIKMSFRLLDLNRVIRGGGVGGLLVIH